MINAYRRNHGRRSCRRSRLSAARKMGSEAFSPSYRHALRRFLQAARGAGGQIESHPIAGACPAGEPLSIDTVRLGNPRASRLVVVSSGVHGVEGYFGSAVQLMFLRSVLPALSMPDDVAVLLLHAVNPYGFAWDRRVTEDNVDLNRNFPTATQTYSGCPDGYEQVHPLINPETPPQWDCFYPRAAEKILRHGFEPLKESIVGGQYECPQGLFYGGKSAAAPVHALEQALPGLIGPAERIVHIDMHCGYGRWGEFKLLVDSEDAASESGCWKRFASAFDAERFEALNQDSRACTLAGSLGQWCSERFAGSSYDTVTAEFGTYSPLKVLAALRDENRAHHWGRPDSLGTLRAKQNLREMFAPVDQRWRDRAVAGGVAVVARAVQAMRAGSLH